MAKRPPLYMESTEIEAQKTAGEVTAILIRAGARQIAMDYDANGSTVGMRFCMMIDGSLVAFSLPVRVEPVFKIINGRRSHPPSHGGQDKRQAERVAWRQLLRWVQAQLAMIETNMTKAEEVFFPYMLHGHSGKTLFEHFQENGLKQLTAGGPS